MVGEFQRAKGDEIRPQAKNSEKASVGKGWLTLGGAYQGEITHMIPTSDICFHVRLKIATTEYWFEGFMGSNSSWEDTMMLPALPGTTATTAG